MFIMMMVVILSYHTFHILFGNLGGWVEAECLSCCHNLGPINPQVYLPVLGSNLKGVSGGNVT